MYKRDSNHFLSRRLGLVIALTTRLTHHCYQLHFVSLVSLCAIDSGTIHVLLSSNETEKIVITVPYCACKCDCAIKMAYGPHTCRYKVIQSHTDALLLFVAYNIILNLLVQFWR